MKKCKAILSTTCAIFLAIDTKLFSTTEGYFAERVPDKVRDAYEDDEVPDSWGANAIPPNECVEYDPANASAVVYVPDNYDGSEPFGIYLHNSPGKKGVKPSEGWRKLMNVDCYLQTQCCGPELYTQDET